jgi:SprT protein
MQLSLFQPDPPPEKISTSIRIPISPKRRGAADKAAGLTGDKRILMRKVLEPHLPESSIGLIIEWLMSQKVQLRISNSRTSKFGDYRPPRAGSIPRISVNHNLNKFAFLITLVHEMAHHMVLGGMHEKRSFISFRKKIRPKPHGPEWKSQYRDLMDPFLNPATLPQEIIEVMKQYLENPKASTTADQKLFRALRNHDEPDGSEFIDKLPFDAVFHLRNGRSFRKKEKVRKRYKCISVDNGRTYLFNPMAQVFLSEK